MNMELQVLQPLGHARSKPELSLASVFATILATADPRFSNPSRIDGLAHPTIMAGGWTITAREGCSNHDAFGLYGYCDPRRRCVDCKFGCTTEAHLIKLSRHAGGAPVLWLETGASNRLPTMQVQVWIPSSTSLSGKWAPYWNPAKQRLELASVVAKMTAVIEPGGSLAVKPLTATRFGLRSDIAAMQDRWTLMVDRQGHLQPPVPAMTEIALDHARVVGAN